MSTTYKFIELYLYQNADGSLISREKREDKDYTLFYAIDPEITQEKPLPPGTVLICAKNSSNSTIELKQVYDPFDVSENCLRFIAWFQPVPYTLPLYVSEKTIGGSLRISLKKEIPEGYTELYFSPIHVLPVQDISRFKFVGYQGRCIPDPNGMDLGECVKLYGKYALNPADRGPPPSLIEILEKRYSHGSQKDSHGSQKDSLRSQKDSHGSQKDSLRSRTVSVIAISVLVLFFLFVLIKYAGNNRSKRKR